MKKQFWDIATIAVFCAILFGFPLILLFKKDKPFSAEENRDLAQFPTLTSEALQDGTFLAGLGPYMADQFPFRDFFVGVKGMSELGMMKRENNDVLIGKNGTIAVRRFSLFNGKTYTEPTDFFLENVTEIQLQQVEKLQKSLENEDIAFGIVIPPRSIDVFADKFDFPAENSENLQKLIKNKLENVNYIDIYPDLRARAAAGEYVYYRTDHHFTTLGAYHTYRQIMESFGMAEETMLPGSFTQEVVTDQFYGTTYSKSGFRFIKPDSISLFRHSDLKDEDFTIIKDGESLSGFYDLDFLNSKDKYSLFLSGNSQMTTITKKNSVDRPRLLLAKDSFGLSLAPLLALHFDIVMVNVADTPSITQMAKDQNCSHVLIVYNTENLISAKHLAFVK